MNTENEIKLPVAAWAEKLNAHMERWLGAQDAKKIEEMNQLKSALQVLQQGIPVFSDLSD